MAKSKYTDEERAASLKRKSELAKQCRKRKKKRDMELIATVKSLQKRVEELEKILYEPIDINLLSELFN